MLAAGLVVNDVLPRSKQVQFYACLQPGRRTVLMPAHQHRSGRRVKQQLQECNKSLKKNPYEKKILIILKTLNLKTLKRGV